MTDITINSKTHKNIESYTVGKLSYVLELAVEALNKYKDFTKSYPSDKMEKYGKLHLTRLEQNKKLIEDEIQRKTK